ncbi:MAG TPA: sigma 54-interacting transcriptional regulator [Polyangiaceae bacterium]|nr:sigma 54-interacting transcriptional regulator [Polyangiaceae bacterium]
MSEQTKPPRPPHLQIIVRVRQETRAFPLPIDGVISIGRAADNTIVLDEVAVSEQHALISTSLVASVRAAVMIEHLASRGDTFISRGHPAVPPATLERHRRVELQLGDTLRIGTALLTLEPSAASADVALRALGGAGDTSPPTARREEGRVVRDAAMAKAYELVTRAAATDLPVLILGETGVGKDVVARTVHERSPRSHGPFTVLNCAALAETLIESELFGHEKGAFTGAAALKQGLLEASAGGTVFLDEIGELPLATQAKLLRALEERKVLRVGALSPHSVDVRFVSATNRDLLRRVREGKFRGDLYYRISGVVVRVPPLRERPLEIVPLARVFVRRFCAEQGQPELALEPTAIERLERHRWPGNVRELKNVVERAVILADRAPIAAQHVQLDDDHDERPPPAPAKAAPPPTTPDEAERARVVAALEQCGGNQTRAARLLGISRSALVHRLDRFRLPRPKKT